jgi:hypothetical protein
VVNLAIIPDSRPDRRSDRQLTPPHSHVHSALYSIAATRKVS